MDKLVCRKYGAGARSGMSVEPTADESHTAEPSDAVDSAPVRSEAPGSSARPGPDHEPPTTSGPHNSRHVPAAVRSAVWLRDEARGTFVDARGVRCRATAALQLHHERPFARGGPATPENIRLRCRAHNELAAEQDFRRDFMHSRKHRPTRPDTPAR